jgi:2-dehydro-3-deoxy-D-arabinonate dehydratase
MELTRYQTPKGPRWARDGHWLPRQLTLSLLLQLPKHAMIDLLDGLPTAEPAEGPLLPPVEPMHEVWASGVTYLRSREARKVESSVGDVYDKVYDAERPELFMKATGWRVVGHGMPVRIRSDSQWDVPEPELVLVVNHELEIVGYCAGNDMSSRSIEGENPLYLPQAKIYNQSCALGPGILIAEPDQLRDVSIQLQIMRDGAVAFQGETRTSQMKRKLEELVTYLGQELAFPQGVFLMTGTGIVPLEEFTLESGDEVQITVDEYTLVNQVLKSNGNVHTTG